MYIVYSSVAMDGPFTLVKEGGHFHLVKNMTQTNAPNILRPSSMLSFCIKICEM
jgi:hypothetical protein